MVEVAGKAVHRERAQALKPVAKKGNPNLKG